MEPRIATHSKLQVIGMKVRTTPMSPEIPALWPRFVARIPEIEPILEPRVSYGVMEMISGGTGGFTYLAAVSASSLTKVPNGMTSLVLPGGQYAVFEFALSDINSAFGFIFGTWLPSSGFSQAESPFFERYNKDLDPSNPKSRVEAHIPIFSRASDA